MFETQKRIYEFALCEWHILEAKVTSDHLSAGSISCWIIANLGSDTEGITFVASKLAVICFLCVLNTVSKVMSNFGGENKQ